MAAATARRVVAVLTAVLAVALVAGCGDDEGSTTQSVKIGGVAAPARGPEAWPAPPADQVAELTEGAGVALENAETLIHHAHAHLDVFIDGEHRVVPAGIGIVITDPAVKTFEDLSGTSYGGISPPCDQPCISPLHTHDTSGVVHTESATDEDRTLGQFFHEWDVRLDDECIDDFCTSDTDIAVYVDGQEVPLAGAADITLTNGKEIAIVIGDPPTRIPANGDFSAA